jgi:hypothetical protein
VYTNGIDYLAQKNKRFESQFIETVLKPLLPTFSIIQNPNTFGKHDIALISPENQRLRLEFEADWSATASFSEMIKQKKWQRTKPFRKKGSFQLGYIR